MSFLQSPISVLFFNASIIIKLLFNIDILHIVTISMFQLEPVNVLRNSVSVSSKVPM